MFLEPILRMHLGLLLKVIVSDMPELKALDVVINLIEQKIKDKGQ